MALPEDPLTMALPEDPLTIGGHKDGRQKRCSFVLRATNSSRWQLGQAPNAK